MIRNQPSTAAYRAGWDRVFGGYAAQSKCFVCGTERDGNLEKCPHCGSTWLEKKFANGVYAQDAITGAITRPLSIESARARPRK